jgi:hypothetical protein
MNESGADGRLSTADLAYGRTDVSDVERMDREESGDVRDTMRSQPSQVETSERPETMEALLPSDSVSSYNERWQSIQTGFVDEPQEAVRGADGLVAEVIQDLARSFASQRENLEKQWSRGSDVSTEELRQALRQYRSFFRRLLEA